MDRGAPGEFVNTVVFGDDCKSFLPSALPPQPPLVMDQDLEGLMYQAYHALGRLDAFATRLPDTTLFVYMYVRKEAVLSSQIEGTQSSLSSLLIHESLGAPGVPLDDVQEVSNYVAAMEHGLARVRDGEPITSKMIRDLHRILLEKGRGSTKEPGRFRMEPNWIGGSRPRDAIFVPPPSAQVPECMKKLEEFIQSGTRKTPSLIKAALCHAQFETIHPFLDGNGRVGRLLITLLLCAENVLKHPTLYLSLYFKQRRDEYYDLLQDLRRTGDWESWLWFFTTGVTETAQSAAATTERLLRLFEKDRDEIRVRAKQRAGSVLRIHETLQARPLLSVPEAAKRSGLTPATAGSAMSFLVDEGVVEEITGRRRDRLFVYRQYMDILNEGTEG